MRNEGSTNNSRNKCTNNIVNEKLAAWYDIDMIHAIKFKFPKLVFCLYISIHITELRTKPLFEKAVIKQTPTIA